MLADDFAPAWRFKCKGLAGYITGGRQHGIHFTEGADRAPVTRPMSLNLEHYYAKAQRGGRLLPRFKVDVQSELTKDGTIVLRFAPYENWNVTASITYKFVSEHTVEACFGFEFGQAYQDFEAFISNYFLAPTEPYIHMGGTWTQPQLGDREHRYWVRDDRDASVVVDGRLDEFLGEMEEEYTQEYAVPVDPLRYDYPIMISPIGGSGWSVVHCVEREMCCNLSVNRTWNAHDFSLIGRGVEQGERVSCRAWMTYAKLESMDDAIKLYGQLTGQSP